MAKRLNKNLVGGLTALAFVAITAAGVFMVSSLRETDPERYAQTAKTKAESGDYETAAIYYGRAFQVSENPEYLVELGKMKELNGDEGKAVQTWLSAVTLNPDLLEAHEKILDVLLQTAGPVRIKETAEAILRLNEKNPKALHALGRSLIQLAGQPGGDRERGFALLEEAQQIAPEVYAYAETLALNYWSDAGQLTETDPERARRRTADALDLVKELVVKNQTPGEDAANARVLYATLLAASVPAAYERTFRTVIDEHLGGADRYAAAEKLFQEAIGMTGDDVEVRSNTMTAFARHWFRRKTEETDPARAKEYADKATSLARQAIDAWPAGFNAYLVLAQMYANERDSMKAAQVCEERTERPIDRKGLKAGMQKRNRIQLLLFGAEQYVAAAASPELSPGSEPQLDLANRAEKLVEDAQAEVADPERDGASLHILGRVRMAQGKDREAQAYFEKAEKAEGTPTWQNHRWLGMLRLQHGQLGGAKDSLREATRDPRADAHTWVALAKAHLLLDEPEVALLAAGEALKRHPGLEEALRIQVDAHQKLGRADRVAEILPQLAQDQSTSVFRARVLYQEGKYREAFDMLRGTLAENPDSEVALRWLGTVARKLGNEKEALAVVEQAAQAAPDNFGLKAGMIYLNPDLTEDQRKEKLLGLIQGTPDEYLRAYRLAEYYRAADQPREAMEQFGKAAQMIINKSTEMARRAGSPGLLYNLEMQFLLALSKKEWDAAEAIVQTAIEQNVDGAHGMTFRGRASMAQKQFDAATEALKQALAEQPAQAEAWVWLGECHFLADRKTEAQAAFARAAEMNPENFKAQRWLAQLAKAAGDVNAYNLRLDACLQLNPEDAWVQQEELARQEEKDPEKGIVRRLVMLEKEPNDLANRLQLAHLYELKGNAEEATKHYAVALQHPDAVPGVAWRAAQFHAKMGDWEQAFQVLADAGERAKTKADKAVVLLMAGTLYRQHGELDQAEQQFRSAVDLDPSEITYVAFAEHYIALQRDREALAWLDKGIVAADAAESARGPALRRARFGTLLRLDDRDAARAVVEEYRERYPQDPAVNRLESELHFKLGDVEQAVADLTHYLQVRPGDAAAFYRRAELNASRQRWQAVVTDLEQLRALDPNALEFTPRIRLSQAYDLTDRSDLALSELKTLYEQHPENETICRQYFEYFMKHGRFADAETHATALVNRDPKNPAWRSLLGRAAGELKDSVKALASLHDAAEMSGYEGRYCDALLRSYADFKNYDAGIRFYEETLPAEKRRHSLTLRYAHLLAQAGRTEEAVAAYRQAVIAPLAFRDEEVVAAVARDAAVALGPARVLALFRVEPGVADLKRPNQHLLASMLKSLGDPAEALAVLDTLVNTSTDDLERASLQVRKGVIADMGGNYPLAQQCYEAALKANPDNYTALNNLAFLLADKTKKPAEALPYAEKAARLNAVPTVVDTLAWTLVELKEYGRAIGHLSSLVQRDAEFVAGLVHLGEAYRRTGKFEDAAAQFEQALKILEQNKEPEEAQYREQAEGGLKKAQDKVATP
ncbi:MAG: tetratricopeptide repeat protein [Planctomycetota bacterium]